MNNTQLKELFVNMEELIFRVANVVVKYNPATRQEMQHVFDQWNDVVQDIMKE